MSQELIINLSIALIVILVLFFLWRAGYKKHVKKIMLILVVQAEKAFGSKTGQIKFSEVYNKLPKIVTILFGADEISKMINTAVDYLEILLEENPDVKDRIMF